MKKKSSISIIIICALLASILNAQTVNQKISKSETVSAPQSMPDPAVLLATSMELLTKVGSCHVDMTCKNELGQETSIILDRKTLPDGIIFEKIMTSISGDQNGENNLSMVFLSRPEGIYQLFPEKKKAFYLKFLAGMQKDAMGSIVTFGVSSALTPQEPNSSLTIRLDVYDGKQCYVIEERIAEEVQKAIKSAMENDALSKKMGTRANIPAVALNVYKISTSDSKILLYESYDSEGNLRSFVKYNSLAEVNLPVSFFDIPEDYETLEIMTSAEMAKQMMEMLTQK